MAVQKNPKLIIVIQHPPDKTIQLTNELQMKEYFKDIIKDQPNKTDKNIHDDRDD